VDGDGEAAEVLRRRLGFLAEQQWRIWTPELLAAGGMADDVGGRAEARRRVAGVLEGSDWAGKRRGHASSGLGRFALQWAVLLFSQLLF
jgi:hypothetical protein